MSNAPLATGTTRDLIGTGSRKAGSDLALKLRANSEYIAIPLLALAIAAALFALFLLAIGKSPSTIHILTNWPARTSQPR